MSNKNKTTDGEWEILAHEALPGYKTAFHVIIVIAVLYFLHIFVHNALS